MAIVLEEVSFAYDRDPVLREVSVSVGGGRAYLVLGPTGCGKTTLALLMAGLLRPSGGRIAVDGIDPADRSFPRQAVQIAFQFPEAQMFELSVEKEIAFGLKNFGLEEPERRRRTSWALDLVGLSPAFLPRDPHSLSFGERRKVALASVVALKPAYLILDEPLAGLDWKGRESLTGAVENLTREGMTAIILTHEADLVGEVGDLVLGMASGSISAPRDPGDFFYGEAGPAASNLPDFIRLLHLMSAGGADVRGRPYRLPDVAAALEAALKNR